MVNELKLYCINIPIPNYYEDFGDDIYCHSLFFYSKEIPTFQQVMDYLQRKSLEEKALAKENAEEIDYLEYCECIHSMECLNGKYFTNDSGTEGMIIIQHPYIGECAISFSVISPEVIS